MPTGQQYATNVPQATLTSGIAAGTTSFGVNSLSGWPAVPFTAVLEIGTTLQEPVDVTGVSGNTVTACTRSIDGTTAFAHAIGATFTHSDIGRDFREARTHMDASTNVHGLTGGAAVVGDIQTQTLTNKTLTSPTVNTPTLNGSGGLLTLPAGPDTLVGRATTDTLSNKTIAAVTFSGGANMGSGLWAGSGDFRDQTVAASGTHTGVDQQQRLVGGIASTGGPPATGTFSAGDLVTDTKYQVIWLCTAGGTPGTWTLIGRALLQSTTLNSGGSFAIASIPSWVNNLEIYYMARGTGGTTGGIFVEGSFNLDTSANYVWETDVGQGGSAIATNAGSAVQHFRCGVIPSNGDTANYFGSGYMIIRNIQATTQFKSVSGFGGGPSSTTNGNTNTFNGTWLSTAAITRVDIGGQGATNFATNSSWQVWGSV